MSFKDFELSSEVLKSIKVLGFKSPTLVQEKVLPFIQNKQDIVVQAKTGSGKTAAFAIPIVDKLDILVKNPKVLVLTPTRELAVQVSEEINAIGRYKSVRSIVVYGKQSIQTQINQLKQRVHVVVGTPGRVNDLIRRGDLILKDLDYLVLDEGDELLRRGFLEDIEETFRECPKSSRTLLFSATVPDDLHQICKDFMEEPEWIEIEEEAPEIEERYYAVDQAWKFSRLREILDDIMPFNCLIFANTQRRVDELFYQMRQAGMKPLKLHGGMNQRDRLRSINSFKNGDNMCLIATDLAARGIHVSSLDLVVNYELPEISENYTHRIGRTGRAGEKGLAISFIGSTEAKLLEDVELFLDRRLEVKEFTSEPTRVSAKKLKEYANGKSNKTEEDNRNINRPKKSPVQKQPVDIMRLRVGIGKKKKARANDFVGALSSIDGMETSDIGVIDVRDTCTYIDVFNNKGNLVFDNLKTVKGKTVKIVKINKIK